MPPRGAFLYLVPVIAVIAGAIVLEEEITGSVVAGGAMILAGVAIAEFADSWIAHYAGRIAGLPRARLVRDGDRSK